MRENYAEHWNGRFLKRSVKECQRGQEIGRGKEKKEIGKGIEIDKEDEVGAEVEVVVTAINIVDVAEAGAVTEDTGNYLCMFNNIDNSLAFIFLLNHEFCWELI